MATNTDAVEAGSGMPASPPRENLIRATNGITLIRTEAETMPTLAGHFAVFNEWTEINSIFEGNFMERFSPGAFTKTIREGRERMRVLFNHGHDNQIGDKVLGPIRTLTEDAKGARYEVPLLDTSYNRDLIPGLDAGLYGASFRFRVMQETFVAKPKRTKDNPDGIPERTVTEAQVREFGPVTWPAYPGATAGLRSLTDDFLFARFVDDPERLMALLDAYRNRQMEPEPSEATTPEEPPAAERKEPEPSAATTRAGARRTKSVSLYPNREEKPAWLLYKT